MLGKTNTHIEMRDHLKRIISEITNTHIETKDFKNK